MKRKYPGWYPETLSFFLECREEKFGITCNCFYYDSGEYYDYYDEDWDYYIVDWYGTQIRARDGRYEWGDVIKRSFLPLGTLPKCYWPNSPWQFIWETGEFDEYDLDYFGLQKKIQKNSFDFQSIFSRSGKSYLNFREVDTNTDFLSQISNVPNTSSQTLTLTFRNSITNELVILLFFSDRIILLSSKFDPIVFDFDSELQRSKLF